VKQATGRFPLDSRLLGYNAPHSRDLHRARRCSWICISLALRASLAGRLDSGCGCNVLAPGWLRQKIIWQKASLPYLFRLADVAAQTVQAEDVTVLQQLINRGAPPEYQIVIGGPIGSGRTPITQKLRSVSARARRYPRTRRLTTRRRSPLASRLSNRPSDETCKASWFTTTDRNGVSKQYWSNPNQPLFESLRRVILSEMACARRPLHLPRQPGSGLARHRAQS
jgi:hypothetical protein